MTEDGHSVEPEPPQPGPPLRPAADKGKHGCAAGEETASQTSAAEALLRDGTLEWLLEVRTRPMLGGLQPDASLSWVISSIEAPDAADFAPYPQADGSTRFAAQASVHQLPQLMQDAMLEHAALGPTLLEGLELALAPTQWLTETREHLLAPLSPIPDLLLFQVEGAGIDGSVHRWDETRVGRIAAALPAWLSRRGGLESAVALLEAALGHSVGDAISVRASSLSGQGSLPAPTHGEALISRSLEWYAHRYRGEEIPHLAPVLRQDLVELSSEHSVCFPTAQEDVLIDIGRGRAWVTSLLRLIPVWMSLRIHLNAEEGVDELYR